MNNMNLTYNNVISGKNVAESRKRYEAGNIIKFVQNVFSRVCIITSGVTEPGMYKPSESVQQRLAKEEAIKCLMRI